eukprot:TRINITY_DN4226_c0_g1_i1.p1 TRINITY_DN4226_c0_g1~~TRINITY_DN4226_c0_g1_i1.p1  ORF type:complete len:832 (+),score=239.26 TRINITY_DN4226_c0_g1_i1:443-2938(+)
MQVAKQQSLKGIVHEKLCKDLLSRLKILTSECEALVKQYAPQSSPPQPTSTLPGSAGQVQALVSEIEHYVRTLRSGFTFQVTTPAETPLEPLSAAPPSAAPQLTPTSALLGPAVESDGEDDSAVSAGTDLFTAIRKLQESVDVSRPSSELLVKTPSRIIGLDAAITARARSASGVALAAALAPPPSAEPAVSSAEMQALKKELKAQMKTADQMRKTNARLEQEITALKTSVAAKNISPYLDAAARAQEELAEVTGKYNAEKRARQAAEALSSELQSELDSAHRVTRSHETQSKRSQMLADQMDDLQRAAQGANEAQAKALGALATAKDVVRPDKKSFLLSRAELKNILNPDHKKRSFLGSVTSVIAGVVEKKSSSFLGSRADAAAIVAASDSKFKADSPDSIRSGDKRSFLSGSRDEARRAVAAVDGGVIHTGGKRSFNSTSSGSADDRSRALSGLSVTSGGPEGGDAMDPRDLRIHELSAAVLKQAVLPGDVVKAYLDQISVMRDELRVLERTNGLLTMRVDELETEIKDHDEKHEEELFMTLRQAREQMSTQQMAFDKFSVDYAKLQEAVEKEREDNIREITDLKAKVIRTREEQKLKSREVEQVNEQLRLRCDKEQLLRHDANDRLTKALMRIDELEKVVDDAEKQMITYENKLATSRFNIDAAKAEHKRDVQALEAKLADQERSWKAGGGGEKPDLERVLHLQRQLAKADDEKKKTEDQMTVMKEQLSKLQNIQQESETAKERWMLALERQRDKMVNDMQHQMHEREQYLEGEIVKLRAQLNRSSPALRPQAAPSGWVKKVALDEEEGGDRVKYAINHATNEIEIEF